MNTDWKDKISLQSGEHLKFEGSKTRGFMQEEDIETYAVVREDGTRTGTVKVTDHTAVRGFRRTIRVVHIDASGATLIDTSFRVD